MSRLGRNDPCHCGSGRKYKKCHQQLDEDRAREEKSLSTLSEWVAYHARALREAARPAAELDAAVSQVAEAWVSEKPAPFDDGLFEQHALFDVGTDGVCALTRTELPEGPALERRGHLRAALADSHLSFLEVVEVKRDRGLRLKDRLLETEVWIADPEMAAVLEPLEVIMGRVITMEQRPMLLDGWEKLGFRGRKAAVEEVRSLMEAVGRAKPAEAAEAEGADDGDDASESAERARARVAWLRTELPRVVARGRASAPATRP